MSQSQIQKSAPGRHPRFMKRPVVICYDRHQIDDFFEGSNRSVSVFLCVSVCDYVFGVQGSFVQPTRDE